MITPFSACPQNACSAAPQGGRTVPRIFLDGRFIGGADDVAALDASGELERMLREAGLLGGAAAE